MKPVITAANFVNVWTDAAAYPEEIEMALCE
jgi:hypothetical protein